MRSKIIATEKKAKNNKGNKKKKEKHHMMQVKFAKAQNRENFNGKRFMKL